LPGPATFEFGFQAEAEQSSNGDDAGQCRDAFQRRIDGDGVDDIRRNEKLEPEQDCPAKTAPEVRNRDLVVLAAGEPGQNRSRVPNAPTAMMATPTSSIVRLTSGTNCSVAVSSILSF
jgi:hypothetical protein